ncbi:MAG: 50S ribosomal protein L11 methyltransferase [Desulfovibrio sp.]|jgi:ribosomal protein L11 methyltransferase|nr:50S ribosomal protein L11 methyltransferase [Desulfovibrio sp.]
MPALIRLETSLLGAHTEEDEERLDALLSLYAAQGWEEERLPDGRFVCRAHFTLPEVCRDLVRAAADFFPTLHIAQSAVEEENWLESWKEFFTPVECGTHFLVLAPWMEKEKEKTSRIPIVIEPKMAFGTGHHASTALCLEVLSELFAADRIRSEMRFLDLGCGSGILGIAAAKLGLAGEGLDLDPQAVENALENRSGNGLSSERLALRAGDLDAASPPYDLVLANILAGPLIEMAGRISLLAAQTGAPRTEKLPLLILSGILNEQAKEVSAAYTRHGFAGPRIVPRDEWAALVFEAGES